MDKIARIRQEIEKRKGYISVTHFAEELLSFLDTLSEEPDKSLEDAVRHSEILTYPMPDDGDIEKVMKVQEARIFHEIGFKAGAEWQKSQMLKDAVEGKVFMSFAPGHNQMVMADVDLPTNTKVRIVVLKEEDQI